MSGGCVLQVLGDLTSAGFVVGMRGMRGGYVLAKPAEPTTIWEVRNTIMSEDPFDDRFNGFSRGTQRLVKRALNEAASDMRKRLSALTIADLKAIEP